jgi:inner membrane protein
LGYGFSVDNATHAIAGLLLAEAVILGRRSRGPIAPRFAKYARVASMLANNVGDLDFLYAHRLGKKLGYLLHHRGYTHTLPIGTGLGLLVFSLLLLASRRAAFSRSERAWLLGLCLLGPNVHIAMDYCNNYGVHPFWPFAMRWSYGDCLFIIEPWLWVFAVPALYYQLTSRWGRRSLALVLLMGLVLGWSLRWVPWGAALLATLGAAISWRLCRQFAEGARLSYALCGWLAVYGTFAWASHSVRVRVLSELTRALDTARGDALVDVVVTPAPANPLCFTLVTVTIEAHAYVARAGRAAWLPSLLSSANCRVQRTGLTLGLGPVRLASQAGLTWEGQWSRPLAELDDLARHHCVMSAFLRFARVPFWLPWGKDQLLLGDLRFDRDSDLDFDELSVPMHPSACPTAVPPWVAPRGALWNSLLPQ